MNKLFTPLVGSDRYFISENFPLEFRKGRGFEVFDQCGNIYIDFVCGLGPVILGHGDREFSIRLANAAENGLLFPGFGFVHHRLAESFEAIQSNKRVVSFFKTSSEAITAAIRCASMITHRKHILRCGFLGWHDAEIYNSPYWHEPLNSSKRNTLRYFHSGYRGVSHDEQVHNWVDLNLSTLKKILEQFGDEIAIFAIDIYQLAFMNLTTFTKAISLCRSYGIQILYDETKTAGRTNPVGYLTDFAIQPDYYILGKAIANGMPLSVLLGDETHLDCYREARIGGTYTKDVLSATAAQITFDLMKARNGYQLLPQIGKKICEIFNSAAEAAKISDKVKACPLFDGALFDLTYSKSLLNNFTQRTQLKEYLFKQKILILDGHCSFINLAHESIDHDMLAERFYNGFVAWKTCL